MNRHERRREAKMNAHNNFYNEYIKHLPQVPVDAPIERGTVHHMVVMHDDWCAFYDDKECNCNPIITRHAEPVRS
jgi:hypothetical protein